MPRIFALVGSVFGAVFVIANAPSLPAPWSALGLVAGAVLLVVAVLRNVAGSPALIEQGTGSARVYWIAVAAEVVAIPTGSLVLNKVIDEPDLVVLWVVFVVGAHFLPAYVFGIGRYGELGLVLIVIAVLFGAIYLAADADWAPRGGAVLAGCALLASAAAGNLGVQGRNAREG